MKQLQTRGKLSGRRKVFFGFLTLILVWLVSDLFVYIGLHYVSKTRNIFFSIRPATSDEQIKRWYERTRFHPRLGWDIPEDLQGQVGNRKGRTYESKKKYQAKVFGDSFAFGAGMRDSETFEYLIEEATGWECLNYGVVGYGPDQALLKYIDNKVSTKFTVLCILDENIERCVSFCRGLLWPHMASLPKPRFIITSDGSVTLLENPIKSVAGLGALKDISFLESLAKQDYWAKYYRELNAPTRLNWPATRTITSHFDYFFRTAHNHLKHLIWPTYETHFSRWPHNHLYEEGSEGFKIICHIVNQFVESANRKNEIPLFLLFTKRETLEIVQTYQKKPYQSLVDFLKSNRYSFVDFGDVFGDKDYSKYFISDGHYSLQANQIIANQLILLMRRVYVESEVTETKISEEISWNPGIMRTEKIGQEGGEAKKLIAHR